MAQYENTLQMDHFINPRPAGSLDFPPPDGGGEGCRDALTLIQNLSTKCTHITFCKDEQLHARKKHSS